jgi:hypothetical protein
VLSLSLMSDYSSNRRARRALVDRDRGVRTIAESGHPRARGAALAAAIINKKCCAKFPT